MIVDQLNNLHRYDPKLGFIHEFLDGNGFSSGRFSIQEPEYFGIGLEYITKASDQGLWEAHRRYLDIHVILEGEEIVEVTSLSEAISSRPYEDDYELFTAEKSNEVKLVPGMFLILYPDEVHKTGVQLSSPVAVRKIVFKLLLEHV